jgi:branched-chain amino acid transport system permease protein
MMRMKKNSIKGAIVTILPAGLLGILPLVSADEYLLNIVFLVALYTILSQSWNILGGYCGQISLGHAAFFGIGALTTRYLWGAGLPFYFAISGGGLAAALLACMIGIPALKLKSHYFAIGTLALAMIALITIQNVFPGVDFLSPELLAGYNLVSRYYLALSIAVVTIGATCAIVNSKLGIAMVSVREDEEAAEAIGINTFKYKVIAMLISTFVAGLAGSLFAVYSVSFYRYVPFELWWSFDPLLITFIGGAGTVTGPIVGAVCYVLLKEIFALSLGQVNVLIFGVVFILIVLFLPKGMVGWVGKFRKSGRTDPGRIS